MGYRDDLIQRMKDGGEWEHLTEENRQRIERFSDDEAGRFMVKVDEWEMGDPAVQEQLAVLSLVRAAEAFDGALFDPLEKRNLSEAGELLAKFIVEIKERTGWTLDQIHDALKDFDSMGMAILLMALNGPSNRPD